MRMALMAVAAVVGLLGCVDQPLVRRDAGMDPIDPEGLHAPIGAKCDAVDYWCADYAGVCAHEVCRAQCSAVVLPRCESGMREVHEDLGSGMQCYCAP